MLSTARTSALDSILPDLIQSLNVPNIKPHLKQFQLLTDDEYEQLEISPLNTTRAAAEKMVFFVKKKGPKHEQLFLIALKKSMETDPHQGHAHIIQRLEEEIGCVTMTTSCSHSWDQVCGLCMSPQVNGKCVDCFLGSKRERAPN